ncbi:GGDEF domain-containing protein [Vibrio sp. NTOU-M3]|uniref:GGDEF domain-containing protein n=1 Tax=Vibrio sp. NTOU-M3 TaxID=3234954 RepID=UPI00349FCEDC
MTLKLQTLFFSVLLSIAISGTLFFTVRTILDGVINELLWKYGEVATHYDIDRTLSPILQEIHLVQELSQHPNIISWTQKHDDEIYRFVAEQTLERYRWRFEAKNFFIAVNADASFHFNSVASVRGQSFFRYFLSKNRPQDNWYFHHKNSESPLALNMAEDSHLGITKLWVYQSIIKDGEFLGIVGTGLDVEPFVETLTQYQNPELTTVFIDQSFKVQLHSKSGVIQSIPTEKHNMTDFFDDPKSYLAVQSLMGKQKRGEEASSIMIEGEDGKSMISIHYIDALGWYEVTFVNLEGIVPAKTIDVLIYVTLALTVVLASLIYMLCLKKFVLPIEAAKRQLQRISPCHEHGPCSELWYLQTNIEQVGKELIQARGSIEQLVSVRTSTLYQMAMLDPTTGLLNQKGMERELSNELARAKREDYCFGLLWLDVEKQGLDSSVEQEDSILHTAAKGIKTAVREYDSACRWHDGEFLVLIRSTEANSLDAIASRLNHYIDECVIAEPSLFEDYTLSIGAIMIEPELTLKQALAKADGALYLAKNKGIGNTHIINDKCLDASATT